MKRSLPRKRTILAWHRWIGVFATLFLIVLAVTGIILNHTESLKLDDIRLTNSLILKRYGMLNEHEIRAFQIHGTDRVLHLEDTLYYNDNQIARCSRPIGILEGQMISAIITREAIILITRSGDLVELREVNQLPFNEILLGGWNSESEPVLKTDEGDFVADSDWIEMTPYVGNMLSEPLLLTLLSKQEKKELLQRFQGEGVTLYRVILDLHSGRLFGVGGRTVMDLAAVAILLLILSGIAGWLRKSRKKNLP